jgi:hypothetical protein
MKGAGEQQWAWSWIFEQQMVGQVTFNGCISIRSQNVFTGCIDMLSIEVEQTKFNRSAYGSSFSASFQWELQQYLEVKNAAYRAHWSSFRNTVCLLLFQKLTVIRAGSHYCQCSACWLESWLALLSTWVFCCERPGRKIHPSGTQRHLMPFVWNTIRGLSCFY